MSKATMKVNEFQKGFDFLLTTTDKARNALSVSFICEVCGESKEVSAIAFLKKDKLICGRCSQRAKITLWANENKESQIAKMQKTMIDRYGRANAAQVPEIKEKKKKTNLERYGNEYHIASKVVRGKIEEVFEEKYGGHTPFASADIQKQAKETNLANHEGVWHTATQEYKEQRVESTRKNYGVAHTSQAASTQAKKKETNMKRYGVEEPMSSREFKGKRKQTMIDTYGVEFTMQSVELRKDILQQHFTGHGHVGPLKGYVYEGTNFDSSYELAYYLWLKSLGKQFVYHPKTPLSYIGSDGLEHLTMPDFLVEGKFYEIKGGCFFNKKGEPYNAYTKQFWWEKYNAMLAAGIIIIREGEMKEAFTYVKKAFGKDFLKSCKQLEAKKEPLE